MASGPTIYSVERIDGKYQPVEFDDRAAAEEHLAKAPKGKWHIIEKRHWVSEEARVEIKQKS